MEKRKGMGNMRTLDTKAFLDAVCQMLREGAESVPVPVVGTSMTPFLYPGDTVFLSLPEGPLKKGDIVLYVRPGGRYILHRIVKVKPDGSFLMMGDSQTGREPVAAEQIRAKVVRAVCRGKSVSPGDRDWQLFAVHWVNLAPIRGHILRFRQLTKKKQNKGESEGSMRNPE